MKNNEICISKKTLFLVGIIALILFSLFTTTLNNSKRKTTATQAAEPINIITGTITLKQSGTNPLPIDEIGIGAEVERIDGSWEPLSIISIHNTNLSIKNPKNNLSYQFRLKRINSLTGLDPSNIYRINAYALSKGLFVYNSYITRCSGRIDRGEIDRQKCILNASGGG